MSYNYKPLPGNPCKWTWNTGTKRIYQALGIKGTKVPKNMHGVFRIDGWEVVVKRAKDVTPADMYSPKQKRTRNEWGYYQPRKSKSSEHRIFVRHEGRLVPAGRVSQALCRREVHHARKRASKQRRTGGRFGSR